MRRVHRHAVAGTAASVVTAAVVLLVGGPLSGVSAGAPDVAVPASVAPAHPSASGTAPAAFSRESRESRSSRDGADDSVAERRRAALSRQGKSITEAAEQAARKAEEKRKAEERRRYAELGYRPGTTDPREIARQMMANRFGWGADQFGCYDSLIISESNWRWDATNPSSGAYGIPQSLPASKMASAGPDWRTNPATQIAWGLDYVKDRYGTPCSAWSFKQGHNWY